MFPWFIGIADDEETLENHMSGTWEQLSKSHRDLTEPYSTANGNYHRYWYLGYQFAGSVALHGLGALSDALVGRRKWSDPSVQEERNIVLRESKEAFDKYVTTYQKRAVQIFLEHWHRMVKEEVAAYGERSFFSRNASLADDPDPEPDVGTDAED